MFSFDPILEVELVSSQASMGIPKLKTKVTHGNY